MRLSFLRSGSVNLNSPTYIHSDEAEGQMTAVLYLNLPSMCKGKGTAFWTHRELGYDRADESLRPEAREILRRDGLDESKWRLTGFVGMKWNRLITYPATMFHSRYPMASGSDPEVRKDGILGKDGRLAAVVMYDVI